MGGKTGLIYVRMIALGLYCLEMVFSHFWLKYLNYGPLEWIWQQLTYGKKLLLKKLYAIRILNEMKPSQG
jgi:uncharacterized protein